MAATPTAAAEAEATGAETIEVTYGGESYTFLADPEEYDGDVIDALDAQQFSHALRALLGPDQWVRFKATKPKVGDYKRLIDAWATAAGQVNPGE